MKLLVKMVVGLLVLTAVVGAGSTAGYWIKYFMAAVAIALVLGVAFMIGDTILKD